MRQSNPWGPALAAAVLLVAAALGPPAAAGTPLSPFEAGSFYLGGTGGWAALHSEKDTVPGKNFPQDWQDGFTAGGRIGWQTGGWRLEEEFRYQANDTNTFARHPVQGGRQGYAFMTNAIYDFDLGWPLTPHAGAGIGAIAIHDRVTAPILGIGVVTDGTDWQFAYQAIGGLRWTIAAGLALDVDYRYLGATRPHFRTAPGLVVDGAPAGNLPLVSGYASHAVIASLTLRFDTLARSAAEAAGFASAGDRSGW